MTTAFVSAATPPALALPLTLHVVDNRPAADDRFATTEPAQAHEDSYCCYSCGCEVDSSVQALAAARPA